MEQHEFHPLELALPCVYIFIAYNLLFGGFSNFINPTPSPKSLLERIQILQKRGHYEQALGYIRNLTKTFNTNHVYWQIQADIENRLRLPLEEAQSLEKAFKFSSNPTDVCPALGKAYEKAGDKLKGLEAHKKCLEADPENSDLLYYVANAEEKLSQIEASRTHYEKCLDLSSSHFDCVVGFARIFLREKNPQGALELLARQTVVIKVERDADALFVRALAYRRLDQADKSKVDLVKATQLAPTYLELWLELGKVNLDLNSKVEARQSWQKVLELEPQNEEAKSLLKNIESEL